MIYMNRLHYTVCQHGIGNFLKIGKAPHVMRFHGLPKQIPADLDYYSLTSS